MAKGQTLREVCREEGMPPESTVRRWAVDDVEGFSARYARAKELLHDHWADQIVEIADDSTSDWAIDERGNNRVDNEAIQRSRLRVDTRKWLLSKLQPGKYGERQTHEVTGKNGGPIPLAQFVIDPSKLTDDELDRVERIAARLNGIPPALPEAVLA